MSFSLNRAQNPQERNYHIQAVGFGLHSCGVVAAMYRIEDSEQLPGDLDAIRDYVAQLNDPRSYARAVILKETLEADSSLEIPDVDSLEFLIENKPEALIALFGAISRTSLVNAEFPKSGIPAGVRELARQH